MDAFFLPLISAALAEWGDKTQLLAMLLAARFDRPGLVMAALALAAAINATIASFAGSLVAGMIDRDGALLLLAIAFALAGIAALIPADRPRMPRSYGFGLFGTSLIAFLLAEFGDKTQFLAAGYAAVHPAWQVVALGTWIGVALAMGVAVYGGRALRKSLPLGAIRKGLGALLLLVAAAISINAL